MNPPTAIAEASITDLTIEPARLEEAFLEFYEDAEPRTDDPGTPSGPDSTSVPA